MWLEVLEGTRPPSPADERTRADLEKGWRRWVRRIFPHHFSDEDGDFVPFSEGQERFWDHLWSIERGVGPKAAFFGLPRGQGKSTSLETGAVALGARGIRSYGVYVSGTQDQANEHVGNIQSAIEESDGLRRLYPMMARRGVNPYGHSEGWNQRRLVTASGFAVDALGLDTASARGKKFKIRRPGFIVLDDIDGKKDGPEAVAKKISALVDTILGSGARDVAILGGQNMIHPLSIFARLFGVADPSLEEPDFLTDRITVGPIPAVRDLEHERLPAGHPKGWPDRPRYVITGGTPTWEGMDLATCQYWVDKLGIGAFRREFQHDTEAPPGGMYDHIEFEHCEWSDVPWAAIERVTVWVDPAVTSKDGSDSQAIQADALHADGRIFRLFSWEAVSSPLETMKKAVLKAVELGAGKVGVETDQGGDTWISVFREALDALVEEGEITQEQADRVSFDSDKAGAGHGSKVHRNSLMLSDYERGRFVHVKGTHRALERSLKRFPKTKPLDLADAAYWSWHDLDSGGGPVTASSSSAFGPIGPGSGWGRL